MGANALPAVRIHRLSGNRQGKREAAAILGRRLALQQVAIDQFIDRRHHIGPLDAEHAAYRRLRDSRRRVNDRQDAEQYLANPRLAERPG